MAAAFHRAANSVEMSLRRMRVFRKPTALRLSARWNMTVGVLFRVLAFPSVYKLPAAAAAKTGRPRRLIRTWRLV